MVLQLMFYDIYLKLLIFKLLYLLFKRSISCGQNVDSELYLKGRSFVFGKIGIFDFE